MGRHDGEDAVEPIAIYLLILLTVAVVAMLPRLVRNPPRRTDRGDQAFIPFDPLEQPAQVAPTPRVLAEVE
jgi:hypothetical protein